MAIPDTISHKWVAVAVAPAVLPLVFFLSPIAYLEDYPVRTGLAACSEECPWSSACETQGTGGKDRRRYGVRLSCPKPLP